MLLRLSKFLARFTRSSYRAGSRWDIHTPRTPLRSRSSSAPRQRINIPLRNQSGGSLTDLSNDSSATYTDCDSPVTPSPLSHLNYGIGNLLDRSCHSPASIDKSPVAATDGSANEFLINSPKSHLKDGYAVVPNNYMPMISNEALSPVAKIKTEKYPTASTLKSLMVNSNGKSTPETAMNMSNEKCIPKSIYKSPMMMLEEKYMSESLYKTPLMQSNDQYTPDSVYSTPLMQPNEKYTPDSVYSTPLMQSNEKYTPDSVYSTPKMQPNEKYTPKSVYNTHVLRSNEKYTPKYVYKTPMMMSTERSSSASLYQPPLPYNYTSPSMSQLTSKSSEELSKSSSQLHEGVSEVPEVIGLCVSGQTLGQLYNLLESFAAKRRVEMSQDVLLMCGTNDIKKRSSLCSMTRMVTKVVRMLKWIRNDVNITVLTLPPIPALTSTQQSATLLQYNAFLLEQLEGVKVVDIYSLFMDQDKILLNLFEEFLGNRLNRKKDGVHWNARGMNAVHHYLLQRGIFQH